jgi:hypothetical protein
MLYIHFASNSKTSTQRPRKWLEAIHHKLQGAIEVQTVQGAMEVVKRFEIRAEAVAFTLCKGRSVGGIRKSAIAPQHRPRCITSRWSGTCLSAIVYNAK